MGISLAPAATLNSPLAAPLSAAIPALTAIPSALAPAVAPAAPPAVPAARAAAPQAAASAQTAAQARVAPAASAQLSAAAPGDGGAPQAAPRVFDGSSGKRPATDAVDLASLDPAAQLNASGFYAPVAARYGWERAGEPGLRWLGFYRDLYKTLAAKLTAGHPYRSESPEGPVFFAGGSDAAMAALGLPRSVPDSPVNLFARSAGVSPLDLWTSVELSHQGRAFDLGLDPESTLSLQRMADARALPGKTEALDAVHANVLLKWQALALTPRGLELRALDAASAADLAAGRLRLSTRLGPLNAYEAHYNLIVAYRALEESPRRWTLDPATARLMADSIRALPPAGAQEALELAVNAVAAGRAIAREEATRRLLDFAGRTLGPETREALRRAADLPAARAPESEREELRRLAAPFRTQEHLDALAREPRAPGEAFRFAVIGDAEPGRFWFWRALFNEPGVFWRQLKAAEAEGVDFIFQMGDMVSRGIARNFLDFFRRLAAAAPRRPYLTTAGNHDRRSPHGVTDNKLYRSLFGSSDYYFERGGYRFVVLDSSAQRVTPEQLRWLDQALDTPLKKVVFTHVPPAPLSKWTDWGKLKGAGGFKRGGEEFTDIVSRRGVERVYLGHIHTLDAMDYKGVRYVLTGGGGSPLYPTSIGDKRHHYLVVEAGPDSLVETPRFH